MPSPPSRILHHVQKTYDRCKRAVAHLSLLLVVALFYFGDYFGSASAVLLPAALGVLLAILLETLHSVEASLGARQRVREFSTVADAVPLLCEAVRRDKELTSIDILAATGGTTLAAVLPRLLQAATASQVHVRIRLINPSGPFKSWFPPHWASEVAIVTQRLREQFSGGKATIEIYQYDNLPSLHGIMVNRSHVVLGFFGWSHYAGKPQLAGAERPHRYFRRADDDGEYFLDLFEDWSLRSPQELVFSSRQPAEP